MASLVSRYEKAHPCEKKRNCGDFSTFLRAFVNELWLTKKKEEEEEEEGQNGDLYM